MKHLLLSIVLALGFISTALARELFVQDVAVAKPQAVACRTQQLFEDGQRYAKVADTVALVKLAKAKSCMIWH